jgi:SPP1 gp7 family putative phage head morphogenesis protein
MEPEWRAIHRIADRLTPELRRAFLLAVEQLRGRVSVETLAIALSTNRVAAVEFVLDPDQFAEHLRPAVAVVNEAFAAAGAVAARHLGADVGSAMSFNRTNPQAVRAVDRVGAVLVKNITDETRVAIREVVKRGFTQGIAPRDLARMIREMVGLSESDQMAVINYRFGLLKQGLPADRVDRLARIYADKKLRERALTIARTEVLNASNEGQLELWRQARRDGLVSEPLKVWIVTPDDRLCPRCRPMDGQTRKLDEPFDTPLGPRQRPTLHPRCRCAMGLKVATVTRARVA